MTTGPADETNVAQDKAEPLSSLDAAVAAGPIEWPEDPEGDPTDTPVVVLGVDDDESTYNPFPESRL